MANALYFSDNLQVLRESIKDESLWTGTGQVPAHGCGRRRSFLRRSDLPGSGRCRNLTLRKWASTLVADAS